MEESRAPAAAADVQECCDPSFAPLSRRSAPASFCSAPTATSAQTCPDPASLTKGLTLPMSAVRYLADDALKGRLAGSDGERCAGDYIAREFARHGAEARR